MCWTNLAESSVHLFMNLIRSFKFVAFKLDVWPGLYNAEGREGVSPVFVLGKWDFGHWDWDLITGNGKEIPKVRMG